MITIVLLVLCCRAAFKLAFSIFFAWDLQRKPADREAITFPKIVAIVKVYQEPNVGECVRFWNDVVARFANIDVIVVGTDRERSSGRNSTLDLAVVASESARITVLEATGPGGNGAPAQVNTAVESVGADPSTTWILLADVDSRYGDGALQELGRLVSDGHELVQFNSFFLKNKQDLDWFQKGHALLQTRWTLSHERLRTVLYRFTGVVLTHVVGHGMCMRLDRLRSLGGYANIGVGEDIELGFRICVNGIPIVSPRYLGDSDTPATFVEGVTQERSWSYGPMLYPSFASRVWGALTAAQRVRALVFVAQGSLLYLNWLVSSWVLLAIIFYGVSGNGLALLWLALYAAEHAVCLFIVYRLKFASLPWLLMAIPSLLAARLRHSAPANVGLVQFLISGKARRSKSTH